MKTIKFVIFAVLIAASILPANAQKWGATPEDSAECIMNFSFYRGSYKAKDYDGAYGPWKICLTKCPRCSENLYINGVNILKARINKTTDAKARQAAIDELMALYDTRIANFGKPDMNLPRKAYDLQQLLGKQGVDKYYPLYVEAIRQGGEKVEAEYVFLYFVATIDYVTSGHGDSTLVIDNYDIASDLLDKEYAENMADSTAAKAIHDYIVSVETSFSPFASCEQLVKIYTKKFKQDPDNVDLLKKITNILRKKDCTTEDLFFQATERLYALEPSPETALMVGQMCYSKGKNSDAVKYLKDATDGLKEKKDLYAAYMLMGLAYGEMGSSSAARSAYYKAAEMDNTKGDPYLQIAQLYARSARGVNDGLGGRSAYWAACDMASRARNIDPSSAESANKLINAYSSNFPKQADAFMLNIIDGTSFTVPGWIGATTTVRTRK